VKVAHGKDKNVRKNNNKEVNGQLLAEGEMLQGQVATKFEDGNESRNEGK
jgi:ribosomal protein L27